MITSTPRKTGRPKAFHKDRHGNRIEGLSRLKDGRWRASGPERFTFTEPNEDLAVIRFRAWEEKHGRGKSDIGKVRVHGDFGSALRDVVQRAIDNGGSIKAEVAPAMLNKFKYAVNDDSLTDVQWAWIQKQILERPQWVAQRVGIEQIGWLTDLKKPEPSATLQEVGDLYINSPKITPNWHSKCKMFWREFCDCIGVTKLRDIEQEHIVDYYDLIIGQAQSPTYIRQRFGAIKTILNYPTKRGKWAQDSKRALAYCGVLVQPKRAATDPQPISPEDFRTLYDAADQQTRAILLLALNCCMYAGEVGMLDWSEVDLDKGTVVTARNKTKVVRIATLWPETIEALRKLPRRADSIFITEAGTRADYLCVYRLFKIARKAAKLTKVQFAQIRDGAYTSAVEGGIDINTCRLLAGHATGISDHYVKRRPAMVAAACDAVRQAYAPFVKPNAAKLAAA